MRTLPARISRRSPPGRRSLVSCALLPFLLLAAEGATAGWVETQKLYGDDTDGGDKFGEAVAIDGDTAVVGAEDKGDVFFLAGAAYVFERAADGRWEQTVRLQPTDIVSGDGFGTYFCLEGDTAIVHTVTRKTYVFDRDRGGADQWGQVTWFTAPDDAESFGRSCALSGDTLAIGDAFNDEAAPAGGALYLFDRNAGGGDEWGWVDKLFAPDPAVDARFGAAVAIDGDRMLVSAPTSNDLGLLNNGAAYIFESDLAGEWQPVEKLMAFEPRTGDQFGRLVALQGDVAVLGSDLVDGDKGAVWVVERSESGSWVEVAVLSLFQRK